MSAGDPNCFSTGGVMFFATFEERIAVYPFNTLDDSEKIYAEAWHEYGRKSCEPEISELKRIVKAADVVIETVEEIRCDRCVSRLYAKEGCNECREARKSIRDYRAAKAKLTEAIVDEAGKDKP